MMQKQIIKFKQTDIGTIPEEWSVARFGDLLEGPIRNGIYKPPEFHGSGVKMVNMGELFAYPKIGQPPMKRVKLDSDEIERFSVRDGDLLFARRSLVAEGAGKCSLVFGDGEPRVFESSIIRARPNPAKANPRYLFYLFQSSYGKYLMDTILRQVAVSGITGSDLVNLKVPLPSLAEQNAIARLLGVIDDKIELNQQMNKALEAIRQAIFKHWFVDFESPNEEGKPYKSSGGEIIYNEELGKEIPKGWKVKPIDDIADFLNGLALQKFPPESEDEYLPVIKIRELRQGITDSSDKASTNIPKEYIVDDGDVLFSWSGSLEVVIWTFGKGALNQHLFKVTSKEYPKWFYYCWILHYLPEYRHIAEGKATTMGHIQRHHLKNSLTLVPPAATLKIMDRMLNIIVERMIKINIESRNFTQLRDSLLPKLMSGKIRISIEAD
jgi:type I restriction enzyme S subunit